MKVPTIVKRYPVLVVGPVAIAAGLLLFYTGRMEYFLTEDIRAKAFKAKVDSVLYRRGLLVIWTNGDSGDVRLVVTGSSDPYIERATLEYGVDSMNKAAGSDSIAFLKDGVWYHFMIWRPDD